MITVRHVQSHGPRALPVLIALVSMTPALAADDASPPRLELVCTEQPMMQVAFGEPGEGEAARVRKLACEERNAQGD